MELPSSTKDENDQVLEATLVDDNTDVGKDGGVEAETNAHEIVEASAQDDKLSKDNDNAIPEEVALKGPAEENKPSVRGAMKKPQVLLAKTKIVKRAKKIVRKKGLKGTVLQVAAEQNLPVEQPSEEGITVVSINKDEQSAEPSCDESQKEIHKVIDSPHCSSGKDRDLESSLGAHDMESKKELDKFAEVPQPTDDIEMVARAEPSSKGIREEVTVKSSILKSAGIRSHKGKNVKGTCSQQIDKGSATILQRHTEGVEMNLVVPGDNMVEAEKATEGATESPDNATSLAKKQPRKLRAKAKLRNAPPALIVKTKAGERTSELEQNEQENNNSSDVNKQQNGTEKLNLLELNASEGGQQKSFDDENKQYQLTKEKTGLTENKRRRKKRQGKQVLGSNKKQRKEVVAAADATQQRMEERKEQLVEPEKREMDGDGKAKIGGLIFMCNAKTRPDCFRFSIMGVQEKRKDYVMDIKPGLKLFLYDYDLKLLYGIFQASSAGGMKLERSAFGGSFPAQVRFKVVKDCIPLPESQFKKAIKENYNNRNKFKTELTPKQVFKLKKLFRPAGLPAQLTHTLPIPGPRDADRKRSNKDHSAPSSSRTRPSRRQERSRNATHTSPSPRREEPMHDLYLSEREYRTYGLRRAETSQHYPIPPPESSYRDRVPLDSYRPSVDHDRLLRRPEMERHDRREVRPLHLHERDYHMFDHQSSRRDVLARNSLDSPASTVVLDSYRRDPYYGYEYRASERPPRTYLASPGREDDDLYTRYVTADSLAEYYRSSRRYPSMAEPELLRSSVASRYAYSGSLPYSHR